MAAVALVPVRWGTFGIVVSLWILTCGIPLVFRRYETAATLFALGALAIILFPATGRAREADRRNKCLANAKEIADAVRAYADRTGEMPPPFIADTDGVPIHSWRILILKDLGFPQLYDQYDFAEPWNGPNNSRLAALMPKIFQCPHDPQRETTPYVAPVGPTTLWPPAGDRPRTRFANKTILIIESETHRTHWMAPNDITIPHSNSLSTYEVPNTLHAGGVTVTAFADGSTTALPQSTPPNTLKSILTVP